MFGSSQLKVCFTKLPLAIRPEGVVFKHVGFPWTNIQIPAVFIFPLKLHNRLGQNLVCVPSYKLCIGQQPRNVAIFMTLVVMMLVVYNPTLFQEFINAVLIAHSFALVKLLTNL